jgi:hypothetical protein
LQFQTLAVGTALDCCKRQITVAVSYVTTLDYAENRDATKTGTSENSKEQTQEIVRQQCSVKLLMVESYPEQFRKIRNETLRSITFSRCKHGANTLRFFKVPDFEFFKNRTWNFQKPALTRNPHFDPDAIRTFNSRLVDRARPKRGSKCGLKCGLNFGFADGLDEYRF